MEFVVSKAKDMLVTFNEFASISEPKQKAITVTNTSKDTGLFFETCNIFFLSTIQF